MNLSTDPGAFEHPSNRGHEVETSDYHAASQENVITQERVSNILAEIHAKN